MRSCWLVAGVPLRAHKHGRRSYYLESQPFPRILYCLPCFCYTSFDLLFVIWAQTSKLTEMNLIYNNSFSKRLIQNKDSMFCMCKKYHFWRLCFSKALPDIISYLVFVINPPNQIPGCQWQCNKKDWVQWTKETSDS